MCDDGLFYSVFCIYFFVSLERETSIV